MVPRPRFRTAGGIDEAMIEVYGRVPEYSGCGRPPTRKKPGADWLYLQMVKHRDAQGHFAGATLKVIFGRPSAGGQLAGQEHGLHRTQPLDQPLVQWSPGAQDVGLFQSC
jgi:hypothetical protein